MQIRIVPYEAGHQPHFDRLNRAWIERYFRMEEMDEYMLRFPDKAIIAGGGHIFMALADEEIAGTVALRKLSTAQYELAKMAVDEKYHRRGIARALAVAAIDKALSLGARQVELHSHTSLQPALTLYRRLGFKEVPLDESEFARSDIKMELEIDRYLETQSGHLASGLQSQ